MGGRKKTWRELEKKRYNFDSTKKSKPEHTRREVIILLLL